MTAEDDGSPRVRLAPPFALLRQSRYRTPAGAATVRRAQIGVAESGEGSGKEERLTTRPTGDGSRRGLRGPSAAHPARRWREAQGGQHTRDQGGPPAPPRPCSKPRQSAPARLGYAGPERLPREPRATEANAGPAGEAFGQRDGLGRGASIQGR